MLRIVGSAMASTFAAANGQCSATHLSIAYNLTILDQMLRCFLPFT